MSKVKIMVVGSQTLVTGLALAGLEHSAVATEENFQSELEKVLTKEEYGVVVVQEDFLSKVDWRTKKKLDSIAYPVIVPVPGLAGKTEKSDDLRKLIKRALGFDIIQKG